MLREMTQEDNVQFACLILRASERVECEFIANIPLGYQACMRGETKSFNACLKGPVPEKFLKMIPK